MPIHPGWSKDELETGWFRLLMEVTGLHIYLEDCYTSPEETKKNGVQFLGPGVKLIYLHGFRGLCVGPPTDNMRLKADAERVLETMLTPALTNVFFLVG